MEAFHHAENIRFILSVQSGTDTGDWGMPGDDVVPGDDCLWSDVFKSSLWDHDGSYAFDGRSYSSGNFSVESSDGTKQQEDSSGSDGFACVVPDFFSAVYLTSHGDQ